MDAHEETKREFEESGQERAEKRQLETFQDAGANFPERSRMSAIKRPRAGDAYDAKDAKDEVRAVTLHIATSSEMPVVTLEISSPACIVDPEQSTFKPKQRLPAEGLAIIEATLRAHQPRTVALRLENARLEDIPASLQDILVEKVAHIHLVGETTLHPFPEENAESALVYATMSDLRKRGLLTMTMSPEVRHGHGQLAPSLSSTPPICNPGTLARGPLKFVCGELPPYNKIFQRFNTFMEHIYGPFL
eukprot:tig00000117_g6346.t1